MSTEKMYEQDSYAKEFTAQIFNCKVLDAGRFGVTLDRTLFYPESGGQPFDKGILNGVEVLAVEQQDEDILHILSAPLEIGPARGVLDWKRRFDHMQQHSGQHILSAVFEDVLTAPTVGFHLGSDSSQIDLTLFELNVADLIRIEDAANRIVFENRPILSRTVSPEEFATLEVRKRTTKEFASIRLIDIPSVDLCACGGTHVRNTGDIGLIKIRRWEKKNNAVRVDFVCGWRALNDYRQDKLISTELCTRLSSTAEVMPTAMENLFAKMDDLIRDNGNLRHERNRLLSLSLLQETEKIHGVTVVRHIKADYLPTDATDLAKQILSAEPKAIALIIAISPDKTKLHLVFAAGPEVQSDMNGLLRAILPMVEGKGGGNARLAQGGGSKLEWAADALETALRLLRKSVSAPTA